MGVCKTSSFLHKYNENVRIDLWTSPASVCDEADDDQTRYTFGLFQPLGIGARLQIVTSVDRSRLNKDWRGDGK
jgi:hypothetical protein